MAGMISYILNTVFPIHSARKEAEIVLERKVRASLRGLEVTDAILKTGTLATDENGHDQLLLTVPHCSGSSESRTGRP